jgi:CopG antitoxin of type II toxin-antitoxin system
MQHGDTPLLLPCIIQHGNMPPSERRADDGGSHRAVLVHRHIMLPVKRDAPRSVRQARGVFSSHFATEDEEHRYWATHTLSKALLNQMGPVEDGFLPPPRPRTKPVPIRFSDDIIQRAKVLAARRHIGYQTLLKEFVIERLY